MRAGQASTKAFVDAIAGQRIIAEFGARPDDAAVMQLQLLIALGASAWWFDGDREAARDSWLSRPVKVDYELWRIQMVWVDAAWPRIADIFRSRIFRTIGPGRAYLSQAQVDQLMFGVIPNQ
jgi:hypothetical protein